MVGLAARMSLYFLLFSSVAMAQFGDPAKMRDARRAEAKQASLIYQNLFLGKGQYAEQIASLAREYASFGRPIQAQALFKHASGLEGAPAYVEQGLAEINDKLADKNKLIQDYVQKEKETKDVVYVCKRAAVVFHLGFHDDAIGLLQQAIDTYGASQQPSHLLQGFRMGKGLDINVLRATLNDFRAALAAKDKEAAVKNVGEFLAFSNGLANSDKLVNDLKTTFGDQLDYSQITKVIALTQ